MNQSNPEICELAEVVYEKPLSGTFEKVSFGSELGNTLWVKFSDKNGINEWIGKFGDGGGWGSRSVTKITGPDQFFIRAGGFAYWMDATKRNVLRQYCQGENVQDLVYDAQKNLLITASWTHLNWIDGGDNLVTSKNISVDGIRDLKIEGRTLSGLAVADYGGEEKRFWFDLDELKILRWEKRWWKFW